MNPQQIREARTAFENQYGLHMVLYRGGDSYTDPRTAEAWSKFLAGYGASLRAQEAA